MKRANARHVIVALGATECGIMFLINKIKKKIASIYASWLSSSVKVEENLEEIKITERNNVTCSDFIDYDGHGNYGRFPAEPYDKKKKTKRIKLK